MKRKICTEKVPKKGEEEKSDGPLTEVFHGLGEKSLKSVQTVALSVHTLKAYKLRSKIYSMGILRI